MEASGVPEKEENSLVIAMEVVCVGTRRHKTVYVATAGDIDGTVHSFDDLRGLRAVDEEGQIPGVRLGFQLEWLFLCV